MRLDGSTLGTVGVMRRLVPASFVVCALLLLDGCAGESDSPPVATAPGTSMVGSPTTVAVQRDILATDADPPGAPGRTLTLVRYAIAPGAQLSPHVHPGVQLASIESGSLTYTVETGTATVKRASGATEEVTGPSTTILGPGDAVTETGDMVHFGANQTGGPVVILATLLTEDGQELAVVVTTTTAVPTSTTA